MEERHSRPRWPQGDLGWLIAMGDLPADPVPTPITGGSGLIESGQLQITGFNLVNSSTAAATISLLDGVDAHGQSIGTWNIPASSSLPFNFPNKGVLLEAGLWIVVTTGVVTGTAYVIHWWKYKFSPPAE